MTTIAEVKLWGNTIGAVSLEEGDDLASFQFDSSFAESEIEISPLKMPLSENVYRFPELEYETFYGLPGLLADSLPDRFGTALIDNWLATQGRTPASFNAVERLCYTGDRGMGALEYLPAKEPKRVTSNQVHIDQLVELASEILSKREDLEVFFTEESKEQAMADIFTLQEQLGSAAGCRVTYIGDGNNICRSLIVLGAKVGLRLTVCSPKGYEPEFASSNGIEEDLKRSKGSLRICNDPSEAVKDAQAIYTDVWTSMGQEDEAELRRKVFRDYQVNAALVAKAPQGVLVMHDLPAHRGEEITDEILDGESCIAYDQAENRLHVHPRLGRVVQRKHQSVDLSLGSFALHRNSSYLSPIEKIRRRAYAYKLSDASEFSNGSD